LINAVDQCVFWARHEPAQGRQGRFVQAARRQDCSLALTLATRAEQEWRERPEVAAALIRLASLSEIFGPASFLSPRDLEKLCGVAAIEYARRLGADPADRDRGELERMCPAQYRQLTAPPVDETAP
jgi:hypothetical protein